MQEILQESEKGTVRGRYWWCQSWSWTGTNILQKDKGRWRESWSCRWPDKGVLAYGESLDDDHACSLSLSMNQIGQVDIWEDGMTRRRLYICGVAADLPHVEMPPLASETVESLLFGNDTQWHNGREGATPDLCPHSGMSVDATLSLNLRTDDSRQPSFWFSPSDSWQEDATKSKHSPTSYRGSSSRLAESFQFVESGWSQNKSISPTTDQCASLLGL